MKMFRVIADKFTQEYVNLPSGHSNKETGFWGTQSGVKNLLGALDAECAQQFGGCCGGVVLVTELENIIQGVAELWKSNNNPDFDEGEVFAEGFKDLEKILRLTTEEFYELCNKAC